MFKFHKANHRDLVRTFRLGKVIRIEFITFLLLIRLETILSMLTIVISPTLLKASLKTRMGSMLLVF